MFVISFVLKRIVERFHHSIKGKWVLEDTKYKSLGNKKKSGVVSNPNWDVLLSARNAGILLRYRSGYY